MCVHLQLPALLVTTLWLYIYGTTTSNVYKHLKVQSFACEQVVNTHKSSKLARQGCVCAFIIWHVAAFLGHGEWLPKKLIEMNFWATKTIPSGISEPPKQLQLNQGEHYCIIYSMPFDFRRSVTGWNEFACTKVAPLPTQHHNMSTPWGQISRNHVHQYVDDVGSSTSQLAMQCFMWDLLPSCCMVCDPVAAIEISENQCF